jgi:hypothetical protein
MGRKIPIVFSSIFIYFLRLLCWWFLCVYFNNEAETGEMTHICLQMTPDLLIGTKKLGTK